MQGSAITSIEEDRRQSTTLSAKLPRGEAIGRLIDNEKDNDSNKSGTPRSDEKATYHYSTAKGPNLDICSQIISLNLHI